MLVEESETVIMCLTVHTKTTTNAAMAHQKLKEKHTSCSEFHCNDGQAAPIVCEPLWVSGNGRKNSKSVLDRSGNKMKEGE